LAKECKVADVFHTRHIQALIARAVITSVTYVLQLLLAVKVVGPGTPARVVENLIVPSRANMVSVFH
jgi:hypothetical protein